MSAPSARLVTPPPMLAPARPRKVTSFRLTGPAADHARGRLRLPFGATLDPGADAVLVALGPNDVTDVATVARAIPEAHDVPVGSLVVVLGGIFEAPSLAVRVLGALGRTRVVPRVLRSSALLLRGYTDLGGGVDAESRQDLAWGTSPDPTRV